MTDGWTGQLGGGGDMCPMLYSTHNIIKFKEKGIEVVADREHIANVVTAVRDKIQIRNRNLFSFEYRQKEF